MLFLLLALTLLAPPSTATAQAVGPLAQRLAEARIRTEETRYLQQVQRIDANEARARTAAINQEVAAVRKLLSALPRQIQTDTNQQAESLFQVRIVPLREQWKQSLNEKRRDDRAEEAQRRAEMQKDAEVAGAQQAVRTLARERAQRGEISQADAAREDRQAEQQILALQEKYTGYGAAWGAAFARAQAAVASRAVAGLRQQQRLDDTDSEIGRDAHRAAELTLAVQRGQYLQSQQALTAQQAQGVIAAAQGELAPLQQKYATSAAAADFRDRTGRLVQQALPTQRQGWEEEAKAARETARAAAAQRQQEAARQVQQTQPANRPPSASVNTAPRPQQNPRPSSPSAVAPVAVRSSGGMPWIATLGVLAVGAAGAAFLVFRSRRGPSPPEFASAPPVVAPAPAPAAAPDPGRTAAQRVPPAAAAGSASVKDALFAQQREKYQRRYNDAVDDWNAASLAVTQMAPLLATTHANLQLLAGSLQPRLQALIVERHGSTGKALLGAALLRPLWRLFRRGGVLLKIALIVALYFVARLALAAYLLGGIPAALLVYGLLIVAGFFIERRVMLRAPLARLQKAGAELQALRLSYVFAHQHPQVSQGQSVYGAIRVLAADRTPQARLETQPEASGTGTFHLGVGTLAAYRLEPNGAATLTAEARNNEFMREHGDLLGEVIREQQAFAGAALEPLARYGEAAARQHAAKVLLPQLQGLVEDVERIAKVWLDTYVSDAVFEFLFRSIDMFNMRDLATPPGLLLFGYPGNGKKHLARKIAETLSARFEQVTPSKIASAEQIEALWKASRGTDPVVLFVPNAETVFPKSQDGASGADTLEWLAEWEKHAPRDSRVWVVMTARSDQSLDPAIVDHVGQDSKIEITVPDAQGRRALLELACQQYQVASLPSDAVARAAGGASIQDLRRIVMAAKRAAAPAAPAESHWAAAVRTVRGADARMIDETRTWDRLVLPAQIKQQLQVACRILRDAPEYLKKGAKVPNILLHGPPGTGKTEIARTIANESGVSFMDQKLSDLKGEYQGQSGQNVKRMFDKARAMAPTVLFIDEIDGVAKKRTGGGGDSYTQEVVNELLAQMEGATRSDRPVFILAATNLPDTIDPAVLRRFQQRIEIPLPDEDGRREILTRLLREKQLESGLDVDELATTVARRTDGQSGAALRDVVDRAVAHSVAAAESPDRIVLTRALVMAEADELAKLSSDRVDDSARWDTLVVGDETRAQLRQLSDALRHMETFQRQGIDPPRGAVLWGPPGTGKTQIAKTLANESGVRFLFRTGADLGTTSQDVRAVFDDARTRAPCILFIDEFEKVAEARDKGGSAELVTELLAQMQGAKKTDRPLFVLAATNFLDRMDDAVLSRFTYRIEVPNPDVEQRAKLFSVVLGRYPREAFDVPELAAELARRGGGLSGRDINDVVVRASQSAAQRALLAGRADKVALTRDDLLKEVAEMVRSRSDAVDPGARWDTLVLADGTLRTLKQISTAVRNIEDRLKQGIEPPRGAVLFGPPGTGKTQIARTLANESGVQFLSATAKDLTGQYVGESTQKVARLFAEARKRAPCILFLDEFDSAAASRSGDKGSGFAGEVVSQLLAEMDGVRATGRPVFVLAATNHLEHVDAAVLQRFTYQVEVPNPTEEQRRRLFEIALQRCPKTDFDRSAMADELSRRSGSIGGRQIGDLVRKAAQGAAQRAEEAGTPADIVLTRADLMQQLAPAGASVSEADLARLWSNVVLEAPVKDSLLTMIRLFNGGSKAAPNGLLLYGPPGTGKTEVARLLAQSTGCEFLAADVTTLKGSHVGESGKRVRELWEKALSRGRAVIFVDECDGVFARRGGLGADAAIEEIVNAFLTMWTATGSRGQVWVVGATNKRDRLDEAIDSRFGEKIELALPNTAQRIAILTLELRKLEAPLEVPSSVGNATSGFSGRNLAKLAAAVVRAADARGDRSDEELWQQAIGRMATSGSDAVDPGARWDNLVLQEPVIRRLKRISQMLRHAETLREQGVDPPRATLLFGPPGTGKTQIARTLANESGLNFIAAGPSDIKGAHLGESGRLVRELFERARAKPTVLFIDEIEAGAASRTGGGTDQYTGEIVNELLTQMDGVKAVAGTVFVLAATNHPERVDAAVLSRFEDRLEIPNPGADERRRMIGAFLGKRRVDFDVEQVALALAARTEGLSGRDLMSIVRRASQQAAERAMDAGMTSQIVMSEEDLYGQVAR